jgi:hypothetical protein
MLRSPRASGSPRADARLFTGVILSDPERSEGESKDLRFAGRFIPDGWPLHHWPLTCGEAAPAWTAGPVSFHRKLSMSASSATVCASETPALCPPLSE